MFQANRSENFIRAPYGGFELRDFSILQKSAELLEIEIQSYLSSASDNEIICIELARRNYKDDMKHFSKNFLENAYFLFVESDVETCIERIHHRVTHAQTSRHFVPDHILRGYYSQDNIEYMQTSFKHDYHINTEIKTILNHGSLEDFSAEIENFASAIFSKEGKQQDIEVTKCSRL